MPQSVLINGVPDGLVAEPVRRADGTLPRDRRGRIKTTEVILTTRSGHLQAGQPVPGVDEVDVRWATSATRRWSGITSRFGDRATSIANLLCRAGAVRIRASVTDQLSLGPYRSWEPTFEWANCTHLAREAAADEAKRWQQRASNAAVKIEATDPGLAATLHRARGTEPRLPVLVYAAEDISDGVFHDGPRAFSQTHFADSKARDNAADILSDAGASIRTLATLGLRRSPYIGLGGPLTVQGKGNQQVRLTDFDCPIRFRVDQALNIAVDPVCSTLLIIENLQAAEAICDHHRDIAVIWSTGQPADAALTLIRAAAHSMRVLVVPDADLGGVRIANRIVSGLPPDAAAVEIIDIGEETHPCGEPFSHATLAALRAIAQSATPAANLARGCLARGYRVEQEAIIRAAVTARLENPI